MKKKVNNFYFSISAIYTIIYYIYTGTCTSSSTRHVTLKSPFLLQFPFCKLCDNDDKQSNHRLMNVLCRTKAIFADFSKSPKYNKLQKKETLRFPVNISPSCISLNVKFYILTEISKFFTFPCFLDRSSCTKSHKV